jgi:hypothetical protein
MKPIHKLNNGRGATLCHTCSVIISTGLTKDLYCEKCKPKQETLEQIDQNNPITRGSTALVYKQETLEEVAERLYPNRESFLSRFQDIERKAFIEGVKWQQERSYSEEDMKRAFCNGGQLDYSFYTSTEFRTKMLNKWFEQYNTELKQFKKK